MPCLVSLVLPQDLTKQLDEVTQNSEIVEIRQKEAECELEAARDRVQQQATEILLKASKTLSSSPFLSSPHFSPPQSLLASPPATTRLRFPHTNASNLFPQTPCSCQWSRRLGHFNGLVVYIHARVIIPSAPKRNISENPPCVTHGWLNAVLCKFVAC